MDDTWWRNPDEMDDDQKKVIALPIDKDILIVGRPGSGKTNLLLLRASYLSKANYKNYYVITYNRVLKEFIASGVSGYSIPDSKIRTLFNWGYQTLSENGIEIDDTGKTFEQLKEEIFKGLENVICKGDPSNIVDFLLVDEIQDYSAEEVNILRKFANKLYVVGDSQQRIYLRDDTIEAIKQDFDIFFELKYHYRNGRKICRVADGILNQLDSPNGMEATSHYDEASMPSSVKRFDGLSIDSQVSQMVKEIETQLVAYPGEKIGVLVPRNNELDEVWSLLQDYSIATSCVLQSRNSGYKAFSEESAVVVGTIHGTKGMEFRACHVLGLNFIKNFRAQKNMAFTSTTRPKTSLRLYYNNNIPGYLEKGIFSIEPKPPLPGIEELFNKG